MAYPVRIKICGVTCSEDAEQAARLGAHAIGLNFYPPSPRSVKREIVPEILRALPPFVAPVAVFVNQTLRDLCEQAHENGHIRLMQWHGDNREIVDVYPFRLIPAFSVRNAEQLADVGRHVELCRMRGCPPAAVLIDALVAGQYGGTGQTAPWQLLRDFRPGVPVILAGGLTPDNVAEAVRIVRPFAVDVASGVESAPGRKDPIKMQRFIESALAAAAEISFDA